MPAIENGDGQKIQDAEVDADEGHEQDRGGWAERDGFTGSTRNADDALKVLHGNAAGNEPGNHAKSIGDEFAGLCKASFERLDDAKGLMRKGDVWSHADLVDLVPSLRCADFGSDGKSDRLAVARNFNLKRLALGLVDGVDELIPIVNFLAVDGYDQVAIFHAGNSGRFPGNGLQDFGRNGRVAEDVFIRNSLNGDIKLADGAVMFRLNFEGAALSESFHSAIGLIPSGILDAVDRDNLVANL